MPSTGPRRGSAASDLLHKVDPGARHGLLGPHVRLWKPLWMTGRPRG
jgi:hypothetical protein